MVVLVAAIAHEDTFTVDDLVGAWIGIVVSVAGVVGDLLLPGDGQMPAGVVFAEEQTGRGCSALLTGVPGLEDALNFILPVRNVDGCRQK
jgi:hypothetical protein